MLGGFGTFPRGGYRKPQKPKLGVIVRQKAKPKQTRSRLGVRKRGKIASTLPTAPPSGRAGIAIVGKFQTWPWGQHPDEAYLADAIESLGVPVYRVPQDWRFKPVYESDWVLFTGQPASWQKMPKWGKTHKTILWTLDWLYDYPERHPIIDAARRSDLFVSSDRFDWKSHYGIQNHLYLPGACEAIEIPFAPNPRRSCAFMGSMYNARRRHIATIIQKFGGEVLENPGSWIYGRRLAEFVQSTKVIVGDNARNDIPGYWSTRNYVVPGAGGFLLTSNVPGLEKDFEFGKHIAVYEGTEALEKALKTCISQNDEREEMRRQGFNHVRGNHSWRSRARTLLERIGIPIGK